MKLDGFGELSVEATDAEVYAAVDSAADRVGRGSKQRIRHPVAQPSRISPCAE